LEWTWKLGSGEVINQVQITRYNTDDRVNTAKDIAYLYSDDKSKIPDKNYFTLDAKIGTYGGNDGYMKLTITDVTNQGYNKDGSGVNVMTSNYTYECGVTIRDVSSQPSTKHTKLLVYGKPPFFLRIFYDFY